MRRLVLIALSLVAAGALAACGGGADDAGAPAEGGGQSGGEATTLTMVDNEFEPADLTVAAGTELELANDGQALHNLTVDGIDQDVQSGESASVTIDLEPGEYRMVCKYHEAQGMEATLTVQ